MPELNVGQLDLFKTEELLSLIRIQDVWEAFALAAEDRRNLETS